MADYLVTDTELTSVADAIRTKGGTSASLSFPTEFVSAIEAISGGLEYENGTYSPSADTIDPTISFLRTHDSPPDIILMAEASSTPYKGFGNYMVFAYVDSYKMFGGRFPNGTDTGMNYGLTICVYTAGSGGSSMARNYFGVPSSDTSASTKNHPRYYAGTSLFRPCRGQGSNIFWRAGRTYKWIAIWK